MAGCRSLGLLAVLSLGGPGFVSAQETRAVPIQEFQELRDVVEFCAILKKRPILWDKGQIEGQVRLQPGLPLSTEELWEATVNALARKDLAVVQTPGTRALTVVPLDKAAVLARLESASLEGAEAGYLKVLLPLREISAEEVKGTVNLVLSGKGSRVEAVRESNALLIADFTPQLRQALDLLARIDVPGTPPVIEEVRLERADPGTLAALVEQIRAKQTAVTGEELAGEVLALPDDNSLLVIAPRGDVAEWRALIERFDRDQPLVTEHYSPSRFGLDETADLLEEVVHGDGKVLPGEAWRLVRDSLTGTLIVTTTPAKQREVSRLMARLESAGPEARRPMRTYPIRHRQVQEVLGLLGALLDAGAIQLPDEAPAEAPVPQGPTAPLVRPRARVAVADEDILLTADEGTNRLIAIGEARLLDQLGPLIETLDVKESQVQVEAIAINLTETELLDLGVELRGAGLENGTEYGLASLFGLGAPDPREAVLPIIGGSGATAAVLDPGSFSAVIRAVENVTEGRTMTMPRMLVNNNETATLGSVLEAPYTSTNASNTVATTTLGGTSQAGTQISIKPQVAAGDSLVLDYDISISGFVGESSDPNLPPPRQDTNLKSVVTVPDGFTVIVGGLEQESETSAETRVPWLGEIPLIGRLFSSTSESTSKSRFFVFMRCTVMRSTSFEELKYLSRGAAEELGVDDGWPKLEPRVIR